jgi:hypothetical protein
MRRLAAVISAVFALVLTPRHALALTFHWPTEGSYVHQISHLLFGAAMLFFIREIHKAGLHRLRGVRFLIWSCGILAVWNFDAFIGHWADWTLINPVIIGSGLSRQILLNDFHTWLFYITKIDHFILLMPALYFFYRGLKILAREARPEGPEGP